MFIENATIGSDVEYFLRDKATGEIISAEDLIKGTKHEPYKFDSENPYYATSLDNVLAEGNIPPATSSLEFIEFLGRLRGYIDSNLPAELETVAIPSARLDERFLQTENARIFGCDPSFNCWTGEIIQPVPTGDNLRSAGFHIHIGYSEPGEMKNISLARSMDLFLGIPSVIKEPENERKMVGYGCAGNFRHQPHGVEYRVLSSFFASTPDLIDWSFKNTQLAIKFVNEGKLEDLNKLGTTIQDCINTSNKDLAKELVEQYSIPL